MAIYRRDRYTCVTKQKGGQSMEENVKNLCAPIPAGLHARVREEQEVSGKTLGQYILCLILCCTYVMNMSYAYFNPYATSTLGVAMVGGTIVTIMADYIRPFASVGGGVLADRLGRPRIMTIAFAIMAVGTFAIALFPKMSVPVFVALCALVYVGMYCNYGIVFSLMDDGGIPMEVSGTAVGVICTIGYLPEVVCPATAGIILDTFTEAGYKYYFLAVGIIMLIGIVGIMIWNRSMKKQKAVNK